jgi:hypothetical protein
VSDVRLHRDSFNRLIYTAPNGEQHVDVIPVRSFPLSDPERGIALVNREGRELVWFNRVEDIDTDARGLILAELATREFTPEIVRIRSVSGFVTPCTWNVDTDRGRASFVLKGQEDVRRQDNGPLLIADKHGIQFLVRDVEALDKKSRRLLDRFL